MDWKTPVIGPRNSPRGSRYRLVSFSGYSARRWNRHRGYWRESAKKNCSERFKYRATQSAGSKPCTRWSSTSVCITAKLCLSANGCAVRTSAFTPNSTRQGASSRTDRGQPTNADISIAQKSGRLLLGHAVECAEAENEIAAGNADDVAVGEEAGECVECNAIVGVVEDGHEHEFIGDVEIGVTGRQALAIEVNGFGHGQRLDAQGATLLIFHGAQARQIVLQRHEIRVNAIGLD